MNKSQSHELWLTPLIGLIGLAIFIFKHDGGKLVFLLNRSATLALLLSVVPLFAMALMQQYLRRLKWPTWGRILAAGLIGFVFVGSCYYFAAPHYDVFSPHNPNNAEGWGNAVAILQNDAPILGMIGALAAVISTMLSLSLRPKD